MSNIVRVELSKYSLVITRGNKASITATVITEPGTIDKKGVGVVSEDNDIVTYFGGAKGTGSSSENITIQGISAGSSTFRIYSITDSTKYAILNVNVIDENEPDAKTIFIPYTILMTPREVAVKRNQLFCIRVLGIGGNYKNEIINKNKIRANWRFSVKSADGNEPVRVTRNGHNGLSTAWFRAQQAGTYQIFVYNPVFPEFGSDCCTVTVVEEKMLDEDLTLWTGYPEVWFLDHDNFTPAELSMYDKSPKYTFFEYYNSGGYSPELEPHEVGWRIPQGTHVANVSINKTKNYQEGVFYDLLYINREYKYGIIPITFYLKSDPYVYYPVWVTVLGGNYRDYLPESLPPSSSDIVDVELSEAIKVIEKGAPAETVKAWAKDGNGNIAGSISILCLSKTTNATVSLLPGSENGKYTISMSADASVSEGVVYVSVYCSEKPTVTELLTIYVVDDKENFLVPQYKKVTGIKLDKSKTSLGIGAKEKLNYTIYPPGAYIQDVTWRTSNGEVVTVDSECNIVGIENGYAVVSVTTVDGNYTDTCNVYVGGNIPVTKLDVVPESVTLLTGGSQKLTATITPGNATNKSLGFASYDTAIATVDGDGNITGVSAGYTSVTVYADDGLITRVVPVAVFDNQSDIPVYDPEHPELNVVSINLSPSKDTMQVDESRYLVSTITYGDQHKTIAAEKSIWSSSNSNIVSVTDDGFIQAKSIGVATITVRALENTTVSATCVITVVNNGTYYQADQNEEKKTVDYIYRIEYKDDSFTSDLLYAGNLDFDLEHPIESVVYYETEDIQKIYWVDGKNVLRFMNFMAKPGSVERLQWSDGLSFDSNRAVNFGVEVSVSKNNSGNTRPNGVIQYLLTYYNKHGQESGYAWISDLIYLSPVSSGGAADGTNNNSVTLNISELDDRFSYFRIYSVFRSALDGTTTAYIVFDGKTDGRKAVVIDNNSHLTAVDAKQLLYLGSQNVVANTLTHKDQTLFLGDLSSVDRDYTELEDVIKRTMIGEHGLAKNGYITFELDDETIPNDTGNGTYAYNSQLVYSSSQITSFKGGEKYRFGIVFHKKDGSLTDAFWIGDAVNTKYPEITDTYVKRIIAKCNLPWEVIKMAKQKEYGSAQLVIAEPTYADRSVKAQGIVCPTVFNVWNRFMNRLYSASSWMMRPRNAEYAWKHFEPIHNATSSTGEIDCNYWETVTTPTPYYSLQNYSTKPEYVDEFDGQNSSPYAIIVYRIYRTQFPGVGRNRYHCGATVILLQPLTDDFSLSEYTFSQTTVAKITEIEDDEMRGTYTVTEDNAIITIENVSYKMGEGFDVPTRIQDLYNKIISAIRDQFSFFNPNQLVDYNTFYQWCDDTNTPYTNTTVFFNYQTGLEPYATIANLVNDTSGTNASGRWIVFGEDSSIGGGTDYIPSYYRRHLTFVDENVVTLNSPEIEYEAISFDKIEGHKFRIVGVAKIDGQYSDYTVVASPGKLSGENLIKEHFSKTLIGWPLWRESGLNERKNEEGGSTEYKGLEDDKHLRDSMDYEWGGGVVKYWLRMWNHGGKISGYTDVGNHDYSHLTNKVFANSRYSNKTVYYDKGNGWVCEPDSIRLFNYTSSQYVSIDIGKTNPERRYYDGVINDSISLPQNHKYPVLYTIGTPTPSETYESSGDCYLYLSDPVPITYASTPHAVISLPTEKPTDDIYKQTILPRLREEERVDIITKGGGNTGALLPWIQNTTDNYYPYRDYLVKQDTIGNLGIGYDDQYVFVGEIYYPFEDGDEIRYGGTSDAAIQNNRFIIAGPQYLVSQMPDLQSSTLVANQGDTYIQRWDCLKTKPYSSDAVNNVVDITSVMLETHINIDGRTDLQRGTSYIASIDAEKFGQLNPVYTQHNNFITQRDLDEDFNLDAYRSSITWTLEKHDSADIDEWTHITLASTLKLDGDKGVCQALRRFGNSIIAFQDRGISEILFNSRTQLTTQDGVPVEIANSGKVDGKRYITNKFGCVNKWSIVEGKSALYFVDNINKQFCSATIEKTGRFGVGPISDQLGFSTWFKRNNSTTSWTPAGFDNIVSFYDRVHSDVYLVKKNDSESQPCLVYNEALGAFTSFFDYASVPMMTNVEDKFVSFKNHKLWLQNEGMYCNFFGKQYDYWVQYRVTPEPFSDKIWTNIDYRADFYEVLNSGADSYVPEECLINGDVYDYNNDLYKEWETFTDYRVWNEYQDTGYIPFTHERFDRDDVRKKFRIWRLAVPRALKEGTNRHGMDRIRNPWINLLFRKEECDGKYLMQLHDIVVKYFE